jgi:hypothetical protein
MEEKPGWGTLKRIWKLLCIQAIIKTPFLGKQVEYNICLQRSIGTGHTIATTHDWHTETRMYVYISQNTKT